MMLQGGSITRFTIRLNFSWNTPLVLFVSYINSQRNYVSFSLNNINNMILKLLTAFFVINITQYLYLYLLSVLE